MVDTVRSIWAHAPGRTQVVPMELADMRMAREYDAAFWAAQHALDEHRGGGGGGRLFREVGGRCAYACLAKFAQGEAIQDGQLHRVDYSSSSKSNTSCGVRHALLVRPA